MNILDLNYFFWNLQNEIYCIIKGNNITQYEKGGDIDIFCYNTADVCNNILSSCNAYLEQGEFTVKVTQKDNVPHIHVDIMNKQGIEFRFDLYGKMPNYRKVNIKEGLFSSIIENAVEKKEFYKEREYNIYIANPVDDLIIRYIEFMEYYNDRPSKKKHWEYILEKITSDNVRIDFFDKVHYYTELPDCDVSEVRKWTIMQNLKGYYIKMRGMSVKELMQVLKRKMKKWYQIICKGN